MLSSGSIAIIMSEKNSSLRDLLENDASSRRFFESLSPQMQSSLLEKNAEAFKGLRTCAEQYDKNSPDGRTVPFEGYNPSCSANDCTGLIPQGSNHSEGDFNEFKQLYPFSNPAYTVENEAYNDGKTS